MRDNAALIAQKTQHYAKEDTEARRLSRADTLSVPEKLALACRILAQRSHSTGLAGQATARDPEAADTFWTQTYGLAMEEAEPGNLIRVNGEIDVVEGSGMANPANRFHAWIYRTRSDVGCIIHTHAPHVSALSMLNEPLAVAHMDTMALFGDVAWLSSWPGVPFGDEEGRLITGALGEKRAILLANHGLLTAAGSIEDATVLAVAFEHAARLQLLARSAGEIHEVAHDLGSDAHAYTRGGIYSAAHFRYWVRQLAPDQRRWMVAAEG